MDKHDRETMIKVLMKLKLDRKLLDRMKDSEIQILFSTLNRHVTNEKN
jgi:hypothetical protein